MKNRINKDLFGKALLDYQSGNYTENIITYSSIAGRDEMELPFLFRSFDEMPYLEQIAMQLCDGQVLDVGCGSGSHSIYLQNNGVKVKAIDISAGAIETCKKRGINNAEITNIWDIKEESFDTIIVLMNGTGICEKLSNLSAFLKHLKSLLRFNGQILIDSSDVIYMLKDHEEEFIDLDNENYYGEVTFELEYKNEIDPPFNWLFVDFYTLQYHAGKIGLKCELAKEGYHHDYLAKLTFY